MSAIFLDMRSEISALPLDARMLLRSLAGYPGGLTVHAIARHWEPTWTSDEVKTMLDGLARMGVVRGTGTRVVLYQASPCFQKTTPPLGEVQP